MMAAGRPLTRDPMGRGVLADSFKGAWQLLVRRWCKVTPCKSGWPLQASTCNSYSGTVSAMRGLYWQAFSRAGRTELPWCRWTAAHVLLQGSAHLHRQHGRTTQANWHPPECCQEPL